MSITIGNDSKHGTGDPLDKATKLAIENELLQQAKVTAMLETFNRN